MTAVRSPGRSVPRRPAPTTPKWRRSWRKVPPVAAEDANTHAGLDDRVNLAGHGEDERGFAAAVGPENGHVLAGADGEVDVVEHDAIAAGHVDLAKLEELRCFGLWLA